MLRRLIAAANATARTYAAALSDYVRDDADNARELLAAVTARTSRTDDDDVTVDYTDDDDADAYDYTADYATISAAVNDARTS